jgi:hypothetical protein
VEVVCGALYHPFRVPLPYLACTVTSASLGHTFGCLKGGEGGGGGAAAAAAATLTITTPWRASVQAQNSQCPGLLLTVTSFSCSLQILWCNTPDHITASFATGWLSGLGMEEPCSGSHCQDLHSEVSSADLPTSVTPNSASIVLARPSMPSATSK